MAKVRACAVSEEAEVTLPQSATEYDGEMQGILSALILVDTDNKQESEATLWYAFFFSISIEQG